ncbi:MAG: prepilin-type N-terminal cleavage/methylation domain-containing protein [Candidatus Glassbacteria bacterium]|nr:prepilin-type N-terminal cleavage/methylation domain-containing protein [Candidatus Glassbacteria bacterium]
MRNSKGFTLIEIIVAVALVAILSAAVAPSVLNNIAMGRISRTQSDVQAIASGVMRFKSDTGKYPRLDTPANPDTLGEAFDFLVSTNGTWPTLVTNANWPSSAAALVTGIGAGSAQTITNHLIIGQNDYATTTSDTYIRANNPEDPTDVGFRQGYISSDPPDPWGNRYMINVAPLGMVGQPVWVISAGPNGVLETLITNVGTATLDTVNGDDIGFRVQ